MRQDVFRCDGCGEERRRERKRAYDLQYLYRSELWLPKGWTVQRDETAYESHEKHYCDGCRPRLVPAEKEGA